VPKSAGKQNEMIFEFGKDSVQFLLLAWKARRARRS
jgi:hypothetical protein